MNVEIPDYGNIKDLIKRGKDVDALDLVLKLREACIDLRDQLQAANDRIRNLEETQKLKSVVSLKNNVCWIEGDPQPICPVCWETKGQAVHLYGPHHSDGDVHYTCRVHEKMFYTRFNPNAPVAFAASDDFEHLY